MARLSGMGMTREEDEKRTARLKKEAASIKVKKANTAPKQSISTGAKTSQPSTPKMNNKAKAAAAMSIAQQTGALDAVASTGTAGAGLSGAASGALAGAQFGPKGALIGGAIGGITGALKSKSKRKEAARKAQADHHKRVANIEKDKVLRLQSALQSLGTGFSQSLL